MDRSEIINLLNNPKNMRNVVFWVGAGIDADAPTSLPLGEELTNLFSSRLLIMQRIL